ncbi:MAG TPA: DoxX family protein [Candidatus Solibacter sp.]|nr:DoxX family protein [Candidatus Solibacter sp.]
MTWLRAIVAAGLLAGLLLSPKLWLSDRVYPQTPVWSGLHPIPAPFDYVLYGALLLAVVAAAIKPDTTAILLVLAAILVAFDQSRLQPWFFQYWFMLLVLSRSESENLCRLIVFSIYFWSGLQKLNSGFAAGAFPWLVEPLKIIPAWVGYAAPFIEAGIALALLFRPTRRAAVLLAIAMHAAILLAIGPLGHNTNNVVWPWNITMAASAFLLFWRADFSARELFLPKQTLACIVLILFTVAPALSFFGAYDNYLSWALYAGNKDDGDLYFSDAVYDKLPDTLQDYVTDEGPDRAGLNIGTWSFGELNVPAYPELRIYGQVHRSLCRYGDITLEVERKSTLLGDRPKLTFTCASH